MITSKIIQVCEGQLYIGTWDLCMILGIEHRQLKDLVKKRELIVFGEQKPFLRKRHIPAKGGRIYEYMLGKREFRIVSTLLPNKLQFIGVKLLGLEHIDSEIELFRRLESL